MKRNEQDNVYHILSDKEFVEFQNDKFEEIPTDILNKAVDLLKSEINDTTKEKIKEDIRDDPLYWFAPYHFGWGMAIRNLLRDKICSDDKLPSGNWDLALPQQLLFLVCTYRR